MNRNLLTAIIFLSFCSVFSCHGQAAATNPYPSIGAIPAPPGYIRTVGASNSFAAWLRTVPLKKDKTVYLYNGTPKRNQGAQFAVLDISTGDKDLQQCADAVMRLRAEFLYSTGDLKHIDFLTAQGTHLNFLEWANGKRFRLTGGRLTPYTLRGPAVSTAGPAQSTRAGVGSDKRCFQEYLETVFAYCGTLSLEKQLDPVARSSGMHIGDVLIKGGSPGHAMLVVDMAEDRAGRKLYLLAQSYMPAQDIHIVKNIYNSGLSPWYLLDEGPVYTPEWTFFPGQLRRWSINY